MKKTRFFTCLLALIMVVSMLTITAAAADIHLVADSAIIYVDDIKVRNINAYLDGEGEIRVESENDLRKIFPNDLENSTFLTSETGIIVTQWVISLGYSSSQDSNTLYIYTSSGTPSIPSIVDPTIPTVPAEPSIPGTQETATAEVFVNGLRVNNSGVHTYGGEFFINTYNALYTIFPRETANTYFPATMETSSLRSWATQYKYTMVSSGNRAYLNNDGNTPIEVTLNGTNVTFPDQQAIVVKPGRTMIPIRTVSELINCDVEWDGNHNRVKITKGNSTMLLWVNHQSYWLDGNYYKMDVSPFALNGRTMVPLRFIIETFGYDVKWDSSSTVSVVRLSSK